MSKAGQVEFARYPRLWRALFSRRVWALAVVTLVVASLWTWNWYRDRIPAGPHTVGGVAVAATCDTATLVCALSPTNRITDGGVIILPAEYANIEYLWKVDNEQEGREEPPSSRPKLESMDEWTFSISRDALAKRGARISQLDARCHFSFTEIVEGRHVVCWLRSSVRSRLWIAGCDRADVRVPGKLRLVKNWGGVHVRVLD